MHIESNNLFHPNLLAYRKFSSMELQMMKMQKEVYRILSMNGNAYTTVGSSKCKFGNLIKFGRLFIKTVLHSFLA